MISKNFKVLEVINGKEYVFSSFAFKAGVRRYKSEKKVIKENVTGEMVLEEIAEVAHVSVDSIKNWMYAKNGPGDLEIVKAVADCLNMNYIDLLKEQEKKYMSENNVVAQNIVIDTEKTKDVIRIVYQKMSSFMDAAVEELCFDSDEETYWKYDEVYKDMVGTLHRSMLDIPIGIYDQLKDIAEGDLYMYIYGIPECSVDIWDLTDFHDLCQEKEMNSDSNYARMIFMQKEADKFYASIREILKDYLLK